MGTWIQHQQAIALQQAQMQQQAQLQQQHLAAQLYSQQQSQLANQNAQLFHAQQQTAQNQFNKDWQSDRDLWARDNATADWQRNQQSHQADLKWNADQAEINRNAQAKIQQDQFERQQQALWQSHGVEQAENNIDGTIQHIADNIDLLPQDRQTKFRTDFYAPWQAIKGGRVDGTPPAAYGAVLKKFSDDFQKSGTLEAMQPRLNNPQQFERDTVKTGGSIYGRDRSGAWRRIADEPDPIGDFLGKNLRYFQNTDTNEVDMEAAMKAAQEYVAARERMKAGQPIAPPQQQVQQQQQAQPDHAVLAAPNEAVLAWQAFKKTHPKQAAIVEEHARWQQGGQQPNQAGMQQQAMGGQGPQGSLTPGQQAEINRLAQQGQPLTPEQVAFQQQMAAHGQQQAQQTGQTFAAPPGGKVLEAETLPAATRSQLPRLHSKEEVAAFRAHHGSGVPFEGPDGKVYQTN